MARKKAQAKKPSAAPAGQDAQSGAARPGDIVTMLLDLLAGRLPVPGEVLLHLRAAELEILKALHALIEKQIQRVESSAASSGAPRVRKVKIED